MRRWHRLLGTCALVCALLPVSAAAESLSAGFATNAIFVSQKDITAGEVITVYTVLANSSEENFSGDVVFTIDGTSIGSKHIVLGTGEAQTPSITWTAVKGTHTASAHIEKIVGSDSDVTVAQSKTDTITLSVKDAPPPTPQAKAVESASNVLTQGTSYVAPVTDGLYHSLENLRENAVQKLSSAVDKTAPHATSTKGGLLSASAFKNPDAASATATNLLEKIWRWILQGLLYICSLKVLFYVVLLFVIYLLYRLITGFFRERRHR